MAEWECKYHILDIETPRHELLSAQFKRSSAYYAILNRLPVMLTNIIDNLTRCKDYLVKMYGENAREEIKQVIARVAKLKYELQTDKNFLPLENNEPDLNIWNAYLEKLSAVKKTFFRSCWLDAECYTYRKVHTFFAQTETLREYDYFSQQKQEHLQNSLKSILNIAKIHETYVRNVECLAQLFQFLIWSHRPEVLLSNYSIEIEPDKEKDFLLSKVMDKQRFILHDDTEQIWECLLSADKKKPIIVDIVLNNAGYECFVSLLIGNFLIEKDLATKVRFHVKPIPWFVLDVMENDIWSLIDCLERQKSQVLSGLGEAWKLFFKEGIYEIAKIDYFWTTAYPYYKMRDISPDLYTYLRQARLLIFNGDLNYRKLLGDFSWDDSEEFITCLRGFLPCSICCVRSIRNKVICGLVNINIEKLNKRHSDWMSSGEFGIIQYAESTFCGCEPDDEAILPPYEDDVNSSLESCGTKMANFLEKQLEEEASEEADTEIEQTPAKSSKKARTLRKLPKC